MASFKKKRLRAKKSEAAILASVVSMTAKTFRRVPTHSIIKARGTRSQISKKVFFDEVHVQEYPMILGDNPSV